MQEPSRLTQDEAERIANNMRSSIPEKIAKPLEVKQSIVNPQEWYIVVDEFGEASGALGRGILVYVRTVTDWRRLKERWQLLEMQERIISFYYAEMSIDVQDLGEDLLTPESLYRVIAQLAKSAEKIQEAAKLALEIYDRCETVEEAYEEMQNYEGDNEWIPLIGQALENNDWSVLAI